MKNFKLRSALCALGLLANTAFAADVNTDQSSVWKVSKGEDKLYVGGTIHILPITEFPLPSQFMQAYEQSDTVILEAKLPDPTDTAAQQKMMAAAAYEEGKSLKDAVSPETYAALEEYFAPFGAKVEKLAKLKPGFMVAVMVAMEAQRTRMAGEGVDSYFSQMAKRDNKPMEYLETMEFQLNMIANMGAGEEDRLISESLAMMPEFKQYLDSIIAAWRVGDTEALKEMTVDKMKRESPASFDEMMIQRNKRWISQIEAMFGDDDQELVLVGAGHLVGDDNVLALLEARGYQIEKL